MIRLGDLILVHGSGLIGGMIDWAEHGVYSHVAIYAGNNLVLEAQGGRVIGYQSLSIYKGHYDIGYVNATETQRHKVLAYAKSKIGIRYGWKTIILLFFKLVFHVNCKYNKSDGIICSDFGAWAWRRAGKALTKKKWLNTPQDLADSIRVRIERGVT